MLWLLPCPALGQLCSWVSSNLTWASGARLDLSLTIQQVDPPSSLLCQKVNTWTVGFSFDEDVTLEAWMGDIVKHSRCFIIVSLSTHFTQQKLHPNQQMLQWCGLPLSVS